MPISSRFLLFFPQNTLISVELSLHCRLAVLCEDMLLSIKDHSHFQSEVRGLGGTQERLAPESATAREKVTFPTAKEP